jgi:hypothetical protein
MRRFLNVMVLGLMVLAGTAAAQTASGGFEVDTAPATHRGRAIPIGGDAAYGVTYYDDAGWYTAVLPPEHTVTNGGQPGSMVFDIRAGSKVQICSGGRFPGGPDVGKSLAQLQTQADSLLNPGGDWERGAAAQMVVEDRRMVDLTDGAKGKPVRVALFSGPMRGRSDYLALGVVLVPKGALLLSCNGVSAAQSRGFVRMVFRVAEGAL